MCSTGSTRATTKASLNRQRDHQLLVEAAISPPGALQGMATYASKFLFKRTYGSNRGRLMSQPPGAVARIR